MSRLFLLLLSLTLPAGCGGVPQFPPAEECDTGQATNHQPPPEGSISTVSLLLRNTTQRGATFYVSSGLRSEARPRLYEMHWLRAGDVVRLPDAVAGPSGANLFLAAIVVVEGLLKREHVGEVALAAPQHCCTLTLSEVEGVAVIEQACQP